MRPGCRGYRCGGEGAVVVRGAVLAGLSVLGALLAVPGPVAAWPAVQDPTGVHLCDSRPDREPDGRWSGTWGPPRGGSGYDELDPWLGRQGGSAR